MFRAMYTNPDGSLRTIRVSLVLFLAVLGICWAFHETSKSKQMLLVKVAHVLTHEKTAEIDRAEVNTDLAQKVEKKMPVPDTPIETKSKEIEPKDLKSEQAQAKDTPEEPSADSKSIASNIQKPGTPVSQDSFAKKTDGKPPAAMPAHDRSQSITSPLLEKVPGLRVVEKGEQTFVLETDNNGKKQNLKFFNPEYASDPLELPSQDYQKMYTHWRKSGSELDGKTQLVSLRILNLENEFKLFQMKAVALKNGEPFADLTDRTRIAPDSLSVYSSTCFVVNRPWKKWGQALRAAGFNKSEDIQVRYYTYDFIRNAIYARAMKAFDWSLAKQNLPKDTPASSADVLGRVYGVKQAGGGEFGVFVPTRVDFESGNSIIVDPLACFGNEPDILALNRAGVL